jgi:hypothetical protein
MTESAFTSKLLAALRKDPLLKDCGAVIFKHCDRLTAGIPDFSITVKGRYTTWWEVKVMPNGLSKIQKYYIDKLKPAAHVLWVDGNKFHLDGTVGTYTFKQLIDTIAWIACTKIL